MITVLNTKISLPQGETGTIKFYFKDYKTDAPLVLDPSEYDRYIEFKVSDAANNTGNTIIDMLFNVNTSSANPIEDESQKITINGIDMYPININWFSGYDSYEQTIINGAKYYKMPINGIIYLYDYENSSISVTLNRSDTEGLTPRTYYYEIGYIEKDADDNIIVKETWIPPTEFVVTGAVI